jgi:hypothetical protein
VKDVCREIGVAENTYYRWKSKYGGMSVSDARPLERTRGRESSSESGGGRADAGQAGIQGRVVEKRLTPATRREAVIRIRDRFGLSERRACDLVGIGRSTMRYQAEDQHHESMADDEVA